MARTKKPQIKANQIWLNLDNYQLYKVIGVADSYPAVSDSLIIFRRHGTKDKKVFYSSIDNFLNKFKFKHSAKDLVNVTQALVLMSLFRLKANTPLTAAPLADIHEDMNHFSRPTIQKALNTLVDNDLAADGLVGGQGGARSYYITERGVEVGKLVTKRKHNF